MEPTLGERLVPELRRKIIHLLLLSVIGVGRLLGDAHAPWAPTGFLLGAVGFEVLRRSSRAPMGWFHDHFSHSLRPHEVSGVLGTVPFFATVCPLAWIGPWARLELVVLVVLVGDAAAALTGRGLSRGSGRTVAGSIAYVAAGTAAAIAWGQPPGLALALAGAGAGAERLAGALHLDDNWVAPPLTFLVSSLLRLPR